MAGILREGKSSLLCNHRLIRKYKEKLTTIYTIDSAYGSARQVFDFVGAPLPQGATRMQSGMPYLLWRAAWDFSQAYCADSRAID